MERITEQTEVKKLCGQIDTVTEELAVLKRLLMEEENFFQMLTLGEIGKETRLGWMRDIFGSHISDETLAFFCILLDRQGLYHFSQVLASGRRKTGDPWDGIFGGAAGEGNGEAPGRADGGTDRQAGDPGKHDR